MLRNSKGFTIVELLTVIVLLLLIGGVSFVSFFTINNKTRNKQYNNVVDDIEAAAEVYLNKNSNLKSSIYNNKGFILVDFVELKNNGLIKEDLINPKSNKEFKDSDFVNIHLNDDGSEIECEYMGESVAYLRVSPKKETINKSVNYDKSRILKEVYAFNKSGNPISKENISYKIYYSANNHNYKLYNKNYIDNNGESGYYKIEYSFNDDIENKIIKNIRLVYADLVAPKVKTTITESADISGYPYKIKYNINANDDESGLARTPYSISGSGVSTSFNIDSNDLSVLIERTRNSKSSLYVRDKAGNVTTIDLLVNKINVPDFVGKSENVIKNICKNYGITPAFTYSNSSSNHNNAIAQNLAKGTAITDNMKITITINNYVAPPAPSHRTHHSSGSSSSSGSSCDNACQMKKNSAAWHSAGDKRDDLHKANLKLGKEIGASYNKSSGVWKDKNGNRIN